MKNDFHDRIERIVEYLNQQVESTLSLHELAQIAGISPFHFHRVYRAVTGETPFGTVRRLRMLRALILLRDTERTVTDIAFDVGFESSQAFSRVFKTTVGCSAREARQDPARIQSALDELSRGPGHATPVEIDVRLVSVEPFKVIASRQEGPPESLFAAYGELFEWAEENLEIENFRGIYGIPVDDPRETAMEASGDGPRFDCCFDFGPSADGGTRFEQAELGGGLYAVARHVGPYEGLDEKYDALYGSWLSSSDFELRGVPSYNHYLADPESVPEEEWETDIYIPVGKVA
jgi:AraC family transcriptional regulator